jgi:hypothetical protein
MRIDCNHPYPAVLLRLVTSGLLVSCSPDAPTTGPDTSLASRLALIAVCHRPQGVPAMIEVPAAALPAHLEHGDYVTTLVVNQDSPATDDGVHFRRITDALGAARTGRLARGELVSAKCRITIDVSAGTYQGTVASPPAAGLEQFPFVVDVPDITLRGAMTMALDNAGRATGNAIEGIETILTPIEPLPVVATVSTPIIIANGHPDGSAGNGLTVEGFVFQSGHAPLVAGAGGQGVLSLRVLGLTIRGNRFEGGFTESLDLRATSGDVIRNHLSGGGGTCDICLAAPGTYRAAGNRLLAAGVPGITTSAVVGLPVPAGVEPYVLPATAEVWSEVVNNEVRDHLRTPVGVGIRVEAVGTMAPNVHNVVHSIIQNNLLVNNRFGIIVHGGFPVAGTDLRGDVQVTLGGNVIEQSCQTKLLVALSRHMRTLGLNAAFPYLLNSTFTLSLGGNLDWNEVWFGHPAGLGNTLIVDGQPIANGVRQFYDAAGCPGL